MSSDPTLKRWYNRYNLRWFGGTLPDVVIYWEPANGNLGETFEIETLEDTGGHPELGIRIDPTLRFSRVLWKMTLLHECCHVKLYPYLGHGVKFQRAMMKLAEAGAFKNLW